MAESTYHQMSVQHIRSLDQHRSPHPVRLVHQQQQPLHSPGVQHPQAEDSAVKHREALVAVQDLERQRLAKLSQDGVASQRL